MGDELEEILDLIRDKDPQKRIKAVVKLGKRRDTEAIFELGGILNDPDKDVKIKAVRALGAIRNAQTVDILIRYLEFGKGATDREDAKLADPVIEETAKALVLSRELAVNHLIHVLNAGDPLARRWAAWALGEIRDTKGLVILDATAADANNLIKQEAIVAIQKIAWVDLKVLVDNLSSDDSDARQWAALELAAHKDFNAIDLLSRLLESRDAHSRESGAVGLGRLQDPRAIPSLVKRIKDPARKVRIAALNALGLIGGCGVVDPLMECLDDPDPYVVMKSALILGTIGAARAVHCLMSLLESSDNTIRWAAITALGHIRHEETIPALKEIMYLPEEGFDSSTTSYKAVRQAAARALGDIGKPALPTLIDLLGDPKAKTREHIAFALGGSGESCVFDPLMNATKDENERIRASSATALGFLGDQKALDRLKEMAKSELDEIAREKAKEAIRRLSLLTSVAVE